MRRSLDRFWTGGPLVVIGDLNANPFHDEVTGRNGLFALRKKDGLGLERRLSNEQNSAVSLHNPMWGLLPDSSDSPPGTYYFPSRKRTELLWHCIDQVIVSAHIEPCLKGPPVILSQLFTGETQIELLHDGRPRVEKGTPLFSDHLPVQLSFDIAKVQSCRTSAKP